MEINDQSVDSIYMGDSILEKTLSHGEISSSGKDVQEIERTMKVLTRVDLDLALSSEKLVNLHVLLMHLLARGDDLETMTMGNIHISATSIEKALLYDLLSGILDSELREVDIFLDALQLEIVDAHHKISSCRHLREIFTMMEHKLLDSEDSLKQSQEHVLELKMQSAKFQRALSFLKHNNCENDDTIELSVNSPLSNMNGKSKVQKAAAQRHILRMLEKSLARELDLEKKISEFKQNEEQLKLKLHHTEELSFRMEEAAEVVWGRFVEAENSAEVLMGISKELLGRLQIFQFNLNGSLQREAEIKTKFEDCIGQLKAKDFALQKLESSNAEHSTESCEVLTLKEKVKSLEEQLKESEIRLMNVNASYEASQEQLEEMENIIESLKENIYEAESRAESAEAKVTQLTDTNLELTEELNFLKGNNDSNAKRVGLLEKQVRELEIQLQNAKASSEASQEQQNMLYSAIWDMETLIEDLKSKVSKAESKTESAEEQSIVLSENIFELNEELNATRDRVKILELSLDEANNVKAAGAKEINLKTKLMMDMVMQLATQRELIQNQVYSLTNQNELLEEKLRYTEKNAYATIQNLRDGDDKELPLSKNDLIHSNCINTSEGSESLTQSIQADEFSRESGACETEVGPSGTADYNNGMASNPEAATTGHLSRNGVVLAIFVSLLSVSVLYFLKQETFTLPL
ncbi:WPP domain-interacting tail-anchored protein 2 isoform X1 [Pistacia vera]|uniref:WPP domain-interacting tail-anchored protein 2 isoform X1 n=1 Tax=Pistacia vera TaxID=55513 RepID=UPI001263445F|nr:WPP domain-interacting tail-anchored protein 2 isoform X1 [Pistacia vera]